MAADKQLSGTEILEKLERVGNLESVITEQRMRMEKLKTTYEMLKAEHIQLQEQNERSERAVVEAKEEIKEVQRQCQEIVTKARAEKDSKIQECEELRLQVLTPKKMEIWKMRLQSEIEEPYRKRVEMLENELQRSKSDYNKMRYDYSFLKSEYEHEHIQYQRMMEELRAQFQTQLENLQQEHDKLIKKQEEVNDTQRLRVLQRENTQLNLKVKSLIHELEEMREKHETAGLQSDHVSKLQARQLVEATSHCKELETNVESLKSQCERLQKDKAINEKQQDDFAEQVFELEKERNTLKSKIEESEHKHRVEMSNVKMELTKSRGDLERERDHLKLECDSLKNKVTVLDNTVEHLNSIITEKEKETCKREQAVKEKEWDKLNKMEQNNLELQATISELERTKGEEKISHHDEVRKLEEELRSINEIKDILETETSSLRLQLKQHKNYFDELEKEKLKNQEMKEKQQKLQTELQSVLNSEQQLMASNDRLKNMVDVLNDEIGVARSDLQQAQTQHEKNKEKNKKLLMEERQSLEKVQKQKEEKLLHEVKSGKKKIEILTKKRAKSKNEIKEIKESMKILQAKEDVAKAETEAVRKRLEAENQRLRKQFDRLKKRQVHFRNVLNNTGHDLRHAFTSTPLKLTSYLVDEDQHQRDILTVRENLDEISESLHRQTDNFGSYSNLTTATNFHENK